MAQAEVGQRKHAAEVLDACQQCAYGKAKDPYELLSKLWSFVGVHIKGGIEIDVDIGTDS